MFCVILLSRANVANDSDTDGKFPGNNSRTMATVATDGERGRRRGQIGERRDIQQIHESHQLSIQEMSESVGSEVSRSMHRGQRYM